MLEDSTCKVPFVSHRLTYPLIRNSVYKFYSVYVHEFEDKSVLLVATEHSKIEDKNVEDDREFVWTPTIESIKRPAYHIALQGVITTIHSNSGLIKRCNKCKSIIHDSCPNNCNEGWGWDLRVSSRLYDGSGSIGMIMTKDITSRVLQKSLSELILLSSQPISSHDSNQFQKSICKIELPGTIEVIEAVSENISSYRKSGKLIVTDGRNLAFLPTNEEHHFTDFTTRQLCATEPEDMKIIRRLIEKALELSIKKVTGHRKLHGIFLLEEPISLYRCERARLYLGFSTRVSLRGNQDGNEAVIEWTPEAYVMESVLDYIQFRRERGASAVAITKFLTTYRNRVIVAPTGNYGSVVEVVMRKASDHTVSDIDTRSLVNFWKEIYDINISPDEIPLLKVKMVTSEATFTYPPSMCFFAGRDSLIIPAGVQKFIESKKSTLKTRMDDVASKVIHDLKIGDLSLGLDAAITEQKADLQAQLLQETRQRLFGRNASAWGSVLFVHNELWFFPNQIRFS
jgi:hypothetical protein